jgi:hypothetical protein
MRKRKWFSLCCIAAILLGAGLTALAVTLKHVPNFYSQNQVEPGEVRRFLANEFLGKYAQMQADKEARQDTWYCTASEAQLNSFFKEHFPIMSEGESLRKLGISDPVVTLDGDHMRLAFRYGPGWFSTVVSYELKTWLVPKEANTIAVEIISARAGAMPISSQSILQQLSEFGRNKNMKVSLYRHEGHPVAVIGLQAEQDPHPKWLLTAVGIDQNNHLVIRGETPVYARRPLSLPIDPGKIIKGPADQ